MALSFVSSSGFQSTSTDKLTIAAPTGIQPGDLLVLVAGWARATRDGSTPASGMCLPPGWTSRFHLQGASQNDASYRVATKVATSSEPSTYQDSTSHGSHRVTAAILVYRGSTGRAVLDVANSSGIVNFSGTLDNAAFPVRGQVLSENRFLIHAGGGNTYGGSAGEFSTPSGETLRQDLDGAVEFSLQLSDSHHLSGTTPTQRTTSITGWSDPNNTLRYKCARLEIWEVPPQTVSPTGIPSQEAFGTDFHTFNKSVFFNYAGEARNFTVPSDVTRLLVECYGAAGGNGTSSPLAAQGGFAKGQISVTPGEVLVIRVGGQGGDASKTSPLGGAGGFNGGGTGGSSSINAAGNHNPGGGGGGGTDVRRGAGLPADRIIVAGGGGGTSGGKEGVSDYPGTGGSGGGNQGGSGNGWAGGGGGGTQTAGGSGGTGATPGQAVEGGVGASSTGGVSSNDAGGGGGGGWFGGGGGPAHNAGLGSGGGGGGGSGYVGGTVNNSSTMLSGVRAGNGQARVWWKTSPITRSVGSISSAEVLGTPTLTQTISPASVDDGGSQVGTPSLIQVVRPTAIASQEAFGTVKLNQLVALTSIATAEAFGAATIQLEVKPTAIPTAEAFGSPTVLRGTVTLSPTGITSTEGFGLTRVAIGDLIQMSGIESAEAFGTASVQQTQITTVGTSTAEASNATSLTLARPAGTVEGDVLFATIVRNSITSSVTPPAGWTNIEPIIDGVNMNGVVFWKRLGASEPANYTFTGGDLGHLWLGAIVAYRGAHATDTVPAADGHAESALLAVNDHSTPAITTTSRGWVLAVYVDNEASTWTKPERFYERIQAIGGNTQSLLISDNGRYREPGESGARTATASVASDTAAMWQIALREAAYSISPTGIGSGESVGSPEAKPGAKSILPVSIESEEDVPSPTLDTTVTVYPGSVTSTEALGVPTILRGAVGITTTGIAGQAATGTPTLTKGPVTLLPVGIESKEAFGTPRVVLVIAVTGIPTSEAFGTPTVKPDEWIITFAGIASAEAVSAPSVARTIHPSGMVTAEAFGTVAVQRHLGLIGIASAEAFGTLTLGSTILPNPFVVINLTHEPSVTLAISAGKDLDLEQSVLAVVLVGVSAATEVALEAKEFTTTHISP